MLAVVITGRLSLSCSAIVSPLYCAEHIMTAFKPRDRLRFPTVISAFSSLFELISSPYHSSTILARIFGFELKKVLSDPNYHPLMYMLAKLCDEPMPTLIFIAGGTSRSHTLIQNFPLCEPGVDTIYHQTDVRIIPLNWQLLTYWQGSEHFVVKNN